MAELRSLLLQAYLKACRENAVLKLELERLEGKVPLHEQTHMVSRQGNVIYLEKTEEA